MPISLLKNAGQKNSKNHWKHRSLTWLRNTRLLVSGAVFMQKSYGSVQGFSTPVGLQLGWLEWCGARGLSMSYFTQVLREITELTSLELFLSHSTPVSPSLSLSLSLLISVSSLASPFLSSYSGLSIPLSPLLFSPVSLVLLPCLCCFSKLTDLNKLPGFKWIIDYGVDF